MTFKQAAGPFVRAKLAQYDNAIRLGSGKDHFHLLEDAHVIGQRSTFFHCLVHFKMLQHGVRNGNIKEVFGQLLRLIGAFTKTAIGLIPSGNTGGSNVSPFKSMPLSPTNQTVMNQIKHDMDNPAL